jgi:hypothetical protein
VYIPETDSWEDIENGCFSFGFQNTTSVKCSENNDIKAVNRMIGEVAWNFYYGCARDKYGKLWEDWKEYRERIGHSVNPGHSWYSAYDGCIQKYSSSNSWEDISSCYECLNTINWGYTSSWRSNTLFSFWTPSNVYHYWKAYGYVESGNKLIEFFIYWLKLTNLTFRPNWQMRRRQNRIEPSKHVS